MIIPMECKDCHKEWNTHFGIQGITQIAEPTMKCPYCQSPYIKNKVHYTEEDKRLQKKMET